MIKYFSMLMPFILEIEENDSIIKKAVFLDFNMGEVYTINNDGNLVNASLDIKNYILESVLNKQIELKPQIPQDDLSTAMNAEKSLSEQNTNHIFRRNNNARS